MARVTTAEVKVILPAETQLTDPQIQAAIDIATLMVDKLALGCGSGLGDSLLKQVELYLSAHYAANTENTLSLKSEKGTCCEGSVLYGFEFGKGIMGTSFGQTANMASCGCLQNFDKRPARIFSIGTLGDC